MLEYICAAEPDLILSQASMVDQAVELLLPLLKVLQSRCGPDGIRV